MTYNVNVQGKDFKWPKKHFQGVETKVLGHISIEKWSEIFWATLKKAIPVPKWNRMKYISDQNNVLLISEQHGDNFENPQNLVDLETPEIYRMK